MPVPAIVAAVILAKLKSVFSQSGSPLPGVRTGRFGIDTRKEKKKKKKDDDDDMNDLTGGIQI